MTGPYAPDYVKAGGVGCRKKPAADYVWVQTDCRLDRDDIVQSFVNVMTGDTVMGRTSGSFSDHIHLYTKGPGGTWTDTGYNLNPVASTVNKNGNLLEFIVGSVLSGVGAGIGSKVGGGGQPSQGGTVANDNGGGGGGGGFWDYFSGINDSLMGWYQVTHPVQPAPGTVPIGQVGSTVVAGNLNALVLVAIVVVVGVLVFKA